MKMLTGIKLSLLGIIYLSLLSACTKLPGSKKEALQSPAYLYVYILNCGVFSEEENSTYTPYIAGYLEALLEKNRSKSAMFLVDEYKKRVESLEIPFEDILLGDYRFYADAKGLKIGDSQFTGYCNLAKVYTTCGDFSKTQEMLHRAVACIPKEPTMARARTLAVVGILYSRAKDVASAQKSISEAMDILAQISSQESWDSLDEIFYIALASAEDPKFIKEKIGRLKFKPESEMKEIPLYMITKELVKQSKISQVMELMDSLGNPQKALTWIDIAKMLQEKKKTEEALDALKKAVEEGQKVESLGWRKNILGTIVMQFIAMKRKKEAMEIIQHHYLQVDESLFWTIAYLGIFADKFNDIADKTEARELLLRAEAFLPQYPLIETDEDTVCTRSERMNALAEYWLRVGDPAKATALLKQARELLTQSWAENYAEKNKEIANIAFSYAKAGENQKAIAELKEMDENIRTNTLDDLITVFQRKKNWKQAQFFCDQLPESRREYNQRQIKQEQLNDELIQSDLEENVPGFDGTWKDFLALMHKDPEQYSSFHFLFSNLVKKKHFSRAEDMIQEIVQGEMPDQQKLRILQTWTWVLNQEGEKKRALNVLKSMFVLIQEKPSEKVWIEIIANMLLKIEGDDFSYQGKAIAKELLAILPKS
ncbi:MAG: hypothetical protein ACOY3I_08810 [Verrucomicrobiota bacterium]